jgi:hypothetical protein
MKRGTKSLLFGVHQVFLHPWFVARAWKKIYGQWPNLYQWIAVICHDLGYWGKPDMDGTEGQRHPEGGAKIARRLAYWAARLQGCDRENSRAIAEEIGNLTLFHSTHYARANGAPVSALYLPDKAAVLTDPMWFYLLRARLSGELQEYVDNENKKNGRKFNHPELWLANYRQRIHLKVLDFVRCECDICAGRTENFN